MKSYQSPVLKQQQSPLSRRSAQKFQLTQFEKLSNKKFDNNNLQNQLLNDYFAKGPQQHPYFGRLNNQTQIRNEITPHSSIRSKTEDCIEDQIIRLIINHPKEIEMNHQTPKTPQSPIQFSVSESQVRLKQVLPKSKGTSMLYKALGNGNNSQNRLKKPVQVLHTKTSLQQENTLIQLIHRMKRTLVNKENLLRDSLKREYYLKMEINQLKSKLQQFDKGEFQVRNSLQIVKKLSFVLLKNNN